MAQASRVGQRHGFTIIELMVSISILLTLLSIGIWRYRFALSNRQLEGAYRQIGMAIRAGRDQAPSLGGGTTGDAVDCQFEVKNGQLHFMVWNVKNKFPPPAFPPGTAADQALLLSEMSTDPGITFKIKGAALVGLADLVYFPNGTVDQTNSPQFGFTSGTPTPLQFVSDSVNTVWVMTIDGDTGIPSLQ